MTEQEKKLCTAKIDGVITSFKSHGLDFPNIITVNYIVNGRTYVLEESVFVKNEPIKIFKITIGQRKRCVCDTTIGKFLTVCYNPSNPHYAYILNNFGRFNV